MPLAHALARAAEALSNSGLDHPEEAPDTLATRLTDLVWTVSNTPIDITVPDLRGRSVAAVISTQLRHSGGLGEHESVCENG